MSTTALSGKSGTLTGAGACGATEIKNWAVTATIDALDATSMASAGWKEHIAGLMGISGTFTCVGTNPLEGAIAQTAAATLSLLTSSDGVTIEGKALITSAEASVSVDGIVTFNCSFVGSEAWTVS